MSFSNSNLLLLVMLLVLKYGNAVITPASENKINEFKYCMRQAKQPNLRECIGRSAISFLQTFEDKDNFTISEGFVAAKDENIAARSLVNFLDTDPVDFRGIMENAGAVFSQRSLEFHMDSLYPGLMFKIGPTADAKSVAEFVIDPTVDERNFAFDEPSTARVLAKQYLLPVLLGLKFNLVALVPLLFAGICLLLKKSLFLAKLAIYVSSVLGIGGALGGLSSLGGLGGLASGFGFAGAQAHAHAAAHAHAVGAAGGGYFPGKTSVYNHYDEDEFHHNNSPYKRNDRNDRTGRKSNFVRPRELDTRSTTTKPIADRFYEYEKHVSSMQDRSGKLRSATTGKLGPSGSYSGDDDIESQQLTHNFMTSDRLGWQVVDVRA